MIIQSFLLVNMTWHVLNVNVAHQGEYYVMLEHEEELFNTPTRVLKLNRNEALYIDDSLTMMLDVAEGNIMFAAMRPLVATANVPAPLDLIEKIAVAVLFTMDDNNIGHEAEVNLNDGDLLCLREICQSYIRIGEEPVGYNLKRKVYTALYGTEYRLGRQLDDVLGSFTPTKDPFSHPLLSHPEDENLTSL